MEGDVKHLTNIVGGSGSEVVIHVHTNTDVKSEPSENAIESTNSDGAEPVKTEDACDVNAPSGSKYVLAESEDEDEECNELDTKEGNKQYHTATIYLYYYYF